MRPLTEKQARALAKFDRHYRAKRCRDGSWCVWDTISQHEVEFDEKDIPTA